MKYYKIQLFFFNLKIEIKYNLIIKKNKKIKKTQKKNFLFSSSSSFISLAPNPETLILSINYPSPRHHAIMFLSPIGPKNTLKKFKQILTLILIVDQLVDLGALNKKWTFQTKTRN